MKQVLLLPILCVGLLLANNAAENDNKIKEPLFKAGDIKQVPAQQPGHQKMMASVFKAQSYLRAEIPDFAFDVHFSVVGAKVYFTGAKFTALQQGTLTSGSLQPVRSLIDKCAPGSIIIFDEIKVVGPDNRVRTIQPVSYVLF